MSQSISQRIVRKIADLVEVRSGFILLLVTILVATAVWIASDLKVDQNFRRLLPDSAKAVQRLDATDARIGNQSDLILAIRSPDREANIRFGKQLSSQLRARRDLDLRYVTFHRDNTFFEKNALLYASLADLLDLRERIRERVKKAVRKNLSLGLDDDEPEKSKAEEEDDGLSKDEIKERYNLDKQLQEYMESDEGRTIVIQARPDRSNSDLTYSRELTRSIETMVDALKPVSFHPELSVSIEGSYAENTRRARSMQSAVVEGSLACLALLFLSIVFYFRSFRAVPWILVPLLGAVVGALAFAKLFYGHLNLVSAFIFAILLGLGIDFSVHMLSRYRDERARGLDLPSAFRRALSTTGLSTSAGALSTAGCFIILSISKFQGFAQFGVVAAVGVVLTLGAALIVLPALVKKTGGKSDHTFGSRAAKVPPSGSTGRLPVFSLIIVIIAAGLGGYGAVHLKDIEFEYDLSKLGPQRRKAPPKKVPEGEPKPKAKTADWKDAIGGARASAPGIILTDNIEETGDVHRQLKILIAQRKAKKKQADGDEGEDNLFDAKEKARGGKWGRLQAKAAEVGEPSKAMSELLSRYPAQRLEHMRDRINTVFSIFDYVPDSQDDKLTVIRDIKKRIDRKRKVFKGKDKEEVDDWYHYLEVSESFGVADLPEWIKSEMTDRDGKMGCFLIFWALGRKADYRNAKEIRDAFFDIETHQGLAPSAAEYYVLPEIIDAIRDDGPKITVLAIVVMFFAAWLLMGGLIGPLVVLSVVGFAVLWLGGIMHALGWKADMFNLIALPLLVGMGQDDALHLYHRYREEGRVNQAVRETGSAIFLTTWTTAIGFGGIFFANHRGLLSLAKVSVIGIVLCWVSSVIVLPAALRLTEWWRGRAQDPAPPAPVD